MNTGVPRRTDLREAMRALVRPFIEAEERGRQAQDDYAPDLRVYDYDDDGDMMIPVPGSPAAAVADLLLAADLVETTRVNVRLQFDDVNLGVTTDPPTDDNEPRTLTGWTLRALEEWVESVAPALAHRVPQDAAFDAMYADFEARFFGDSYTWMSFAPIANCALRGSHIDLEDGLTLRHLGAAERKLRHVGFDDYRGRRRATPHIALVRSVPVTKGERVQLGNALPGRGDVDLLLFCIRTLRPGGAFCDELAGARHTCWGLDSMDGAFSEYRHVRTDRGNTYLDEHASENLIALWAAARARAQDFNVGFLAMKLQDNAERVSVLDRFVDAAIVLQNVYGSNGPRFALLLSWALRGHRDSAARHVAWEFARDINSQRNAILHGDSKKIRALISDVKNFEELTERTEEYMRQSLQLFLMNDGFRDQLDTAALGSAVNFKRLPYSF